MRHIHRANESTSRQDRLGDVVADLATVQDESMPVDPKVRDIVGLYSTLVCVADHMTTDEDFYAGLPSWDTTGGSVGCSNEESAISLDNDIDLMSDTVQATVHHVPEVEKKEAPAVAPEAVLEGDDVDRLIPLPPGEVLVDYIFHRGHRIWGLLNAPVTVSHQNTSYSM